MLLIYTQKLTPRIDYSFKHICTRILGIPVKFTSTIEEFISHKGLKMSYGKQPLGNELFIFSHGLLTMQGFEDIEVVVKPWDETIGFFPSPEKSTLPFDIFSASFYLMSRYEEFLPHVKDELGRFTAQESIAKKASFLDQPVVDIWAYKFKAVVLDCFPDIQFPNQQFKIHNLLEAKQPYAYLQRGLIKNFIGFGSDLFKFRIRRFFERLRVLLYLRKDPYDTFNWVINAKKNSSSQLTVFFLLGEGYTFSEDFNTKREKFKSLVKHVGDYTEIGLLFSFHSLKDYQQLKKEKKNLEEVTHRPLKSTSNDKQLVDLPTIYRDLVELEVARDFTMFYHDELGFRAGTCTPFLYYDLDHELKTPLLIHPVVGTTTIVNDQGVAKVEPQILQLYEQVQKVNGTFSLMFANTDFMQGKEQRIWRYLFSKKLNVYA